MTHFTLDELKSIYENTSEEKSLNAIPEDQNSLFPIVLSGNPVALFEFAQRDGGLARLTYNGEKQKLLIERGILLLISSIKGKYGPSKSSLDFAADNSIKYESIQTLDIVIEKAKELAPKL